MPLSLTEAFADRPPQIDPICELNDTELCFYDMHDLTSEHRLFLRMELRLRELLLEISSSSSVCEKRTFLLRLENRLCENYSSSDLSSMCEIKEMLSPLISSISGFLDSSTPL